MSNSKIVLLAFIIAIVSVIIASFLGSFTESPLDSTIFLLAIVIASVYSVYKQKHLTFFTVCAIACLVILMTSCSSTRVAPISVKVFYQSYGDPRWDDCKDVYLQEYSINIYGDTLQSRRIYSVDCYEGKMKTFADQKPK